MVRTRPNLGVPLRTAGHPRSASSGASGSPGASRRYRPGSDSRSAASLTSARGSDRAIRRSKTRPSELRVQLDYGSSPADHVRVPAAARQGGTTSPSGKPHWNGGRAWMVLGAPDRCVGLPRSWNLKHRRAATSHVVVRRQTARMCSGDDRTPRGHLNPRQRDHSNQGSRCKRSCRSGDL
jgi:hypothetical protein